MAAPSYVNASTGSTDATGAWVATCHAPGAAGAVIILQVLQDGATAGAVTFTSATNIEDLAGADNAWTQIPGPLTNGAWAVGASAEAHQYLWIGRSLSTSAPTFTGGNTTSEDTYWRFYEFIGVSTGTTLATVIENIGGTADLYLNGVGTSNTAADSAVTTAGPDRLSLNFIAVNDDNAISAFDGESNGDWTLAVAPYAESSGTDGAIGLQISPVSSMVLSYQTGTGTYTNFGTNDTSGTNCEQIAQSFTVPNDLSLSQVTVRLARNGNPSDNAVIQVQTDSGGHPSGVVLGSQSFLGSGLSTVAAEKTVAVTTTLTGGATYWIVGTRSGALANDCYVLELSSSAYAGGTTYTYKSGAWSDISVDHSFSVTGTRYYSGGYTINGGTGSIVDSDAWGVVGFALIGTTPTGRQPRHGFVSFQDPGVF